MCSDATLSKIIDGSVASPCIRDMFPVPGLVLARLERRSARVVLSLGTCWIMTSSKFLHNYLTFYRYFCNSVSLAW